MFPSELSFKIHKEATIPKTMLETVLRIGKALRQSPTGLKHHRLIKLCPLDTEKQKVLRLNLPVLDDFSFAFEGIQEISDENIIHGEKLFYPTFKTSDADSLTKYVFGDIYFALSTPDKTNGGWKLKEGGYYRLGDPESGAAGFRVSSFYRAESDSREIENIYKDTLQKDGLSKEEIMKQLYGFVIAKFRASFSRNIGLIERLLRYHAGLSFFLREGLATPEFGIAELLADELTLRELAAKQAFLDVEQSKSTRKKRFKSILGIQEPRWDEIKSDPDMLAALAIHSTGSVFIHFDFAGQHWYEFETEFKMLNYKMLQDFVVSVNASEDGGPDTGFVLDKFLYKTLDAGRSGAPGFEDRFRYRSKWFQNSDEVLDLIFAIDFSKKALLTVPKTEIKIVVLPRGSGLTARHYESFSHRTSGLQELALREDILSEDNQAVDDDLLFAPLVSTVAEDIVQFDLILSKRGSKGMDTDLIEIAGIERSLLRIIADRISKIRTKLQKKRGEELKSKDLKPLQVYQSFLNLLGDPTRDKKKYQSHMYKVLPRIYSGIYYGDPILLPALAEQTEFNVRHNQSRFNFLKYDFFFLTYIQNTKKEGEHLMNILQSQSYGMGVSLGVLARPLRRPIKSFQKSYVGNLRRRIATLEDLIEFKAFLEEKLILHKRASSRVRQASLDLTAAIKSFDHKTGSYDKNKCAFGFFESYFAVYSSTEANDREPEEALAQ